MYVYATNNRIKCVLRAGKTLYKLLLFSSRCNDNHIFPII